MLILKLANIQKKNQRMRPRNVVQLECDSEGEISDVGDLYHMNISVDLANRDLTEADVTEVDQEFINALVEIEGQKEFPCTKCDKLKYVNQKVD